MRIQSFVPHAIKWKMKKLLTYYPKAANHIDLILNNRSIPVYTDTETMTWRNEREYLFQLARDAEERTSILEIGTYKGGATLFLGRGAELSGCHVYSIDPFRSNICRQLKECDGSIYGDQLSKKSSKKSSKAEVEETIRSHGLEHKVTLIEGFSQDIAREWDNGQISLLFIDGNHEESSNDFYAWKRHLTPNAVIAFHDANYPKGDSRVTKSVNAIIIQEKTFVINRVGSIRTIRLPAKLTNDETLGYVALP